MPIFYNRHLNKLRQHMQNSEMPVQMQRSELFSLSILYVVNAVVLYCDQLLSCLYSDWRNTSDNCQNLRNNYSSLNCSCEIEVEQKGTICLDNLIRFLRLDFNAFSFIREMRVIVFSSTSVAPIIHQT